MNFSHPEGPGLGQDRSRYHDFKTILATKRVPNISLAYVNNVQNEAIRSLSLKGVINEGSVIYFLTYFDVANRNDRFQSLYTLGRFLH